MTLVDRKSRYIRMWLVARHTKEAVKEMIIALLKDLPVHTITCYRWRKFADYEGIADELKANVYFAYPYASWEYGTNENTNGLVRHYIPKCTVFNKITNECSGKVVMS